MARIKKQINTERMYSLKYKVTASTCDSNGRLKLFSALQMMQDCSEMWIESEPGIEKYFSEQNMAQLLATRQVDIVRVPEYKEELTVTTSVFDMKPMFGFRNTFIYDAAGNPCYKTWSMGAFVDRSAGRLKRVDEATIASMHLDRKQEMEYRVAAKLGDVLVPTIFDIGRGIIVALAINGQESAIVEFTSSHN